MALNMTINLDDATFSDLVALVKAAEVAGVDKRAPLHLEGSELSITVTTPGVTVLGSDHSNDRTTSQPNIGDAAIRSVIDILTGRQEPPRSNQ
ncbi:hypothetical protein ACXZ66_09740 [Corynebacterium sp. S7]